MNDRARGYWETLEEKAEGNSTNLEGGPTVDNLRELVDAGVLGFVAHNVTRQILYYPSTFDTGERDVDGADFSGNQTGRGVGDAHNAWMEQAEGLDRLFSHSNTALEGGAEFSARLTAAGAGGAERLEFLGHGDDSALSGLLSVATRNEDANYALLTGHYPDGVDADLPWSGPHAEENRVKALEHLYTYDWDDDGAGIRGGFCQGF
ncbi:hypothetical protein ACFXKD_23080 [Nocardiopsis aegyptia]|uniref:TPR repeat region-containing protein n=1 Tax=Nocardiopsis aegyptia TaxID=220378 RepID=UPI00366B19F0